MGVNSLWDIIGPTARPVRLEALSRKKLAVDASIWIYQFLKAVRDKEGNSLPSSHIVGFFRRICKLLYFGILPIFVFDGGVPILKRETINARKNRRLKKAETTRETAQKLLAIQIQRQAESVVLNSKRNLTRDQPQAQDEGEDLVFLEDLPISFQKNRTSVTLPERSSTPTSIKFRKQDEYDLPNITQFKVSQDDARIMPEEEFMEPYEDFDHVDGININEVDPKSKEFEMLPKATQYMILSHLRLKSRLRMGYQKEQLQELFPNSMDFSKFQIQQVQRRNFYTQKLMNVAGMGDEGNVTKRIAGDKDRRYALVKNEDGWTLSLLQEGTTLENPISLEEHENDDITRDINTYDKVTQVPERKSEVVGNSNSDMDSDSEFEDVPLTNNEVQESQEERDFQIALVRSIYDKFENEKSGQVQAIDGFNEQELENAIEESKKDYFLSKEKEAQMVISSSALIQGMDLEKNDNSEFGLDFGSSILFSSNRKEKSKMGTDNSKESNGAGSLGRSFLFSADGRETGKIELKNDHSVPMAITVPAENNKQEKSSEFSKPDTEVEEISSMEQEVHVTNLIESEEDDIQSPKPKEKVTQELPSWFKDEVQRTLNPHNTKFVSDSAMNAHQKDNKEDEEAGLIPWREAKEYLVENEPESSKNDEEIQEISSSIGYIEKQPTIKEPERDGERKAAVIDYDFEQEDEDELVQQLQIEEIDHEILKNQIKATHTIPMSSLETRITEEQLLQEKLQKAKRDSDEVTETMINDVQELLRRFGIPYITSPMEAEAQCAELLKIGLVDGIITDDSDCLLFGGDRVYKNMFNQKQYVECYMKDDIDAKLGLSQEKLIELALLLGSDYTEGIKGIGPVLAMEILAEFESLENFKSWFDENTKTVKHNSDINSLRKSLLTRIKNGKLYLPDIFPEEAVSRAYLFPEVDSDKSEFKWGVPNLDQIRSFLMYNVNWSQERVDEVMIPLIRDMNRKKADGTQSTIGEFFSQEYVQSRKEVNIGKRMKQAANKLNKRRKI
ncbi:DNA repair protein RAD2 [Spathaspora sp. JA1]|nr:DNA repair protein RAD2 [Spathaspora sp. JA1]